MAGGRFDKAVGKVRPGTYINFESGRDTEVISTGTRGTVIIPLPKAVYGPAKQFIRLTNASPDAQAALFGHSIYDEDDERQMLLLREAFKRATTVYAYILTEGDKATADIVMTLADTEDTDEQEEEVSAALVESINAAIEGNLKTNEELQGCSVEFDKDTRVISLVFSVPFLSADEPGLFDALDAVLAKGLTVSVGGTVITGWSDFKETDAYTELNALTEGGSATIALVISDGSNEVTYTIEASYPGTSGLSVTAATASTLSDTGGGETNTITAVAKYGGSRGNLLTVTMDANPLGGYDVIIHLDGSKVAEYEGLYTVEELIEQDNPYVDFVGSGDLGEAAGTTLSGGTDEEATNLDITEFIDAWESVKFNTVCFPFENTTIQQAALTKVKYMRDDMGKGVQVVMPDAVTPDYEGVINVTNSVSLDGDDLSHAEVCAWVAGATAGASYVESLTYNEYAGATAVVDPKNHEEAVAAINNGEFFFSVNENEEIVVEYDINSLTTFADGKDKSYRKNRVIRVYDTLQESIQLNFPPNKYDNDEIGWDIMEGIGKAILKLFEDAGAITNVTYDEDFLVDRELSVDDETYFNVGIQAVDSAEKLYFTVTTR